MPAPASAPPIETGRGPERFDRGAAAGHVDELVETLDVRFAIGIHQRNFRLLDRVALQLASVSGPVFAETQAFVSRMTA